LVLIQDHSVNAQSVLIIICHTVITLPSLLVVKPFGFPFYLKCFLMLLGRVKHRFMDERLRLKPLDGSPAQTAELQGVFEAAPDYFMRTLGHPPGPTEAQSTFKALPPGMGYGDKFVFGVYRGDTMVGCVDLVRGYPDRKTAMLGLLLLSEKVRGQGGLSRARGPHSPLGRRRDHSHRHREQQ
jgi:hypothetical protein